MFSWIMLGLQNFPTLFTQNCSLYCWPFPISVNATHLTPQTHCQVSNNSQAWHFNCTKHLTDKSDLLAELIHCFHFHPLTLPFYLTGAWLGRVPRLCNRLGQCKTLPASGGAADEPEGENLTQVLSRAQQVHFSPAIPWLRLYNLRLHLSTA